MSELARATEQLGAPRQVGQRLVSGYDCLYPPAIGPGDLLTVDFDVHAVSEDGLYLVEETGSQGVVWRGCRRFQRIAEGLAMDFSGNMNWREIDLGATRLRVAGLVTQVYKPAQ